MYKKAFYIQVGSLCKEGFLYKWGRVYISVHLICKGGSIYTRGEGYII